MNYLYRIAMVSFVFIFMISCKNDKKTDISTEIVKENEPVVEEVVPKKTIINNSVLMKTMMTPELETFNRALVTVELTDLLSNEQGPFTILAPTTEAFDNVPEDKMNVYFSPKNRKDFTTLLKVHIVEGRINSTSMLQSIKSNGGKYELQNLNGETLLATLKNGDIFIEDSIGNKARIGKSDINGTNGVVHILDAVLGIPK